jgi:hypothetical protein
LIFKIYDEYFTVYCKEEEMVKGLRNERNVERKLKALF